MNDSIEDLVDEFEAAVKDAAYSDCSPMGDPGNYYKHMERDEARKALMAAILPQESANEHHDNRSNPNRVR